jgi:hypothetical protein
MTQRQVDRAIWIDFEGTTTDDPSMLGVLWTPDDAESPQLTQYVFDDGLRLAAEATAGSTATNHRIITADLKTTLTELVALSDATKRHLASWSLYDYDALVQQLGPVAVRFRNAKKTASRWRRSRTRLHPNLPAVEFPNQELQRYLEFIGYQVPQDAQSDAASNIRYVRERSASKEAWSEVSAGGKQSWQRLVEHNAHDLYGMRAVIRLAVGLDDLPAAAESVPEATA